MINGTFRPPSSNVASNWPVTACRFDVLVRRQWHGPKTWQIGYVKWAVEVRNNIFAVISVKSLRKKTPVTNMNVKRFLQLIKTPSPTVAEVQIVMEKCEMTIWRETERQNKIAG